jgi:pimeloyl-ACP methyl ester carboxylesterase
MTSVPRTAARERIVDAAGAPVAVTEFANPEQPAVVLLHGLGSRGQSWWPVIDPLAARFHLYVLDLRGHGASGKPQRGYRMSQYVADLDAVLEGLELDAPRILGHSLGALITLLWASERPSRATALVLEDPSLRQQPEVLGAFDGWQQLAALTPAEAAAWYRQEYPDWSDEDCIRRAQTITSTAPGVFADLRAETEEALTAGLTDRMGILAEVQSPALLIHGNPELGSMVHPEDAERFVQIMPKARRVFIPTAGHSIHRDASEAFLAHVVPFLAGRES